MDMWICLGETGPVFSWQGQTASDKPVRLATELNKEKTESEMKKEIELIVKKEIAPLHWRVKAGARNKLIQKERDEHEATHTYRAETGAHTA